MCRPGGRRCPACDEPSTANRHNFTRRAKSQGLSVASLMAQSAESDLQVIDKDVDTAAPAQLATKAPKSLRELLAEKQAAAAPALSAKERRRAAAHSNQQWAKHGFAPPGHPRQGIDGASDGAQATAADQQMIEQSVAWAGSLDQDQLDALNDYSMGASEALNHRLQQGQELGPGAQQMVRAMDRALESAGLSQSPLTVYRGISSPAGITSEEWAEVDFPLGSEVQFPGYSSTTTDAAIAASFSNSGDPERSVVFEIKTRQGAPMAAISTYGNGEREHLLPREISARVVGVQYDVPFVSTTGQQSTKTVIQLVEVSALG